MVALEVLTNEFPLSHYGVEETFEGQEVPPLKRRMLKEVFANYSFDLANTDDLKALYYISTYFEDYPLATRLQNVVWKRFGKQLPFEEGFAFLQKELQARRVISLRAVSDFIEDNARTHDEIGIASSRMLEMLSEDSSLEQVARLVVAQELVGKLFLDEKFGLLLGAIGNGEDDRLLKEYLYERWVTCFDYDRNKTIDDIHLNDMLQRLYRLDAGSKFVVIRDLLTGEKGILTDKDSANRRKFIAFFLENYVHATNETEEALFNGIRKVMDQVGETASYDQLYFAIAPLLQERILIEPQNHVSWLNVIKSQPAPRGWGMEEDYEGEDQYDSDEERNIIISDLDAEEILRYITGGSEEQKATQAMRELRQEYEAAIDTLLAGDEEKPGEVRMTVNEFILEVAQKLGAPGVRFLQLLGQYVELTPELETTFNSVYDKVSGQSKITADQTLLREWPEARQELIGLEERLGGGSLMSVFTTHTRDGKRFALKILNPNSGYHTEMTHALMSEVFGTLSKDDPNFEPAVTLLEDIREWIRGDIDFTGFLELDRKFSKNNNGYGVRGNPYKIKVPQSFPPENKYFALEEYVEGTNLTDWEAIEAEGKNLKQVANVLVRNFFEQVKDGLVHSDIHPGNIRVTPDNQVAFLDRNFFVQLSVSDRLFLRNLNNSLNDPDKALQNCFKYLTGQGVKIDGETQNRIRKEIRSRKNPDTVAELLQLVVSLRKEGIKFPLRITLLIKDFYYLDKMAKRAGYDGIESAYKG